MDVAVIIYATITDEARLQNHAIREAMASLGVDADDAVALLGDDPEDHARFVIDPGTIDAGAQTGAVTAETYTQIAERHGVAIVPSGKGYHWADAWAEGQEGHEPDGPVSPAYPTRERAAEEAVLTLGLRARHGRDAPAASYAAGHGDPSNDAGIEILESKVVSVDP